MRALGLLGEILKAPFCIKRTGTDYKILLTDEKTKSIITV